MKRKFGLLLIALFCSVATFGQQTTDLRINELLIKNDSNMVDEYGRHVPWVEIFNTAYNSVNIAGCYLTDDTTGLWNGSGKTRWYRIPQTDPKTLMPQRTSLVFFLDNSPLYGTFHANFDPRNSKNHYVALINSNGRVLIDIMEYPDSLLNSTKTYGCYDDGVIEKDKDGKEISGRGFLEYFTPGSVNKVATGASKAEKLIESDPYGIGMALISISVVFVALILIYCMLKIFGAISRRAEQKAKQNVMTEPQKAASADESKPATEEAISGEVVAAIAVALNMDLDSYHDEESEIITIDMPSAHYSPWSQKHLVMKTVQRRNRR